LEFLENVKEKIKAVLGVRQADYLTVFNLDSPQVQNVLRDLARFCRAHDTTFHQDQRIHALMEGRREVWLRIQEHLNLDSDKLWELYGEGKRRNRK